MYLFSSSLQITEFVSSILLGMNITGLKDELLNEISEFDLMTALMRIEFISIHFTTEKNYANYLKSSSEEDLVK